MRQATSIIIVSGLILFAFVPAQGADLKSPAKTSLSLRHTGRQAPSGGTTRRRSECVTGWGRGVAPFTDAI